MDVKERNYKEEYEIFKEQGEKGLDEFRKIREMDLEKIKTKGKDERLIKRKNLCKYHFILREDMKDLVSFTKQKYKLEKQYGIFVPHILPCLLSSLDEKLDKKFGVFENLLDGIEYRKLKQSFMNSVKKAFIKLLTATADEYKRRRDLEEVFCVLTEKIRADMNTVFDDKDEPKGEENGI